MLVYILENGISLKIVKKLYKDMKSAMKICYSITNGNNKDNKVKFKATSLITEYDVF